MRIRQAKDELEKIYVDYVDNNKAMLSDTRQTKKEFLEQVDFLKNKYIPLALYSLQASVEAASKNIQDKINSAVEEDTEETYRAFIQVLLEEKNMKSIPRQVFFMRRRVSKILKK
jgi:hypothetical protein